MAVRQPWERHPCRCLRSRARIYSPPLARSSALHPALESRRGRFGTLPRFRGESPPVLARKSTILLAARHAVARAARHQVGNPDSAVLGGGTGGLVVLPLDLAQARRGRAGVPTGAGRA